MKKGDDYVMKINAGMIIKIAVSVASLAIGLAEKTLASRELDRKVASKVAEALQNQAKES
jgi:hypothetical protein